MEQIKLRKWNENYLARSVWGNLPSCKIYDVNTIVGIPHKKVFLRQKRSLKNHRGLFTKQGKLKKVFTNESNGVTNGSEKNELNFAEEINFKLVQMFSDANEFQLLQEFLHSTSIRFPPPPSPIAPSPLDPQGPLIFFLLKTTIINCENFDTFDIG